MKYNICIWDSIRLGRDTINRYLNLNNVTIIAEVNNKESDYHVEIQKMGDIPNVDYYLIFEANCHSQIEKMVNLLKLDLGKVLYFDVEAPYETLENLYKNVDSYGIFDKSVTRYFDVFNQRQTNKYLTCTVEGLSYIGDAHDTSIMLNMYVSGENWANDTMRQFYSLARRFYALEEKKQGIFCDIGANIGTTCIYFKKKIDANVKILAFEPSKENFKMLKTNMLLNDIDDSEVMMVPLGVSDIHSKYQVSYVSYNPGGTSLHEVDDTGADNAATVEAIPFDDYIEENNIDIHEIKYIWVDTEGFEGAFLNGARKTLSQIDVPVILEFTPGFLRKNGAESKFMEAVKDLYTSYIIMEDEAETIHPVSELEGYFRNDEEMVQFDIFMLKEDKVKKTNDVSKS
ncbi:MAG: FkbM family methyltransferase [Muribaculaceae bacterium]|nr:FkbM family methyltransferase [Muribaculaceae bacterium]MCM1398949.1 FkbM family methyltransferase [Clostridium sp.]MCM1458807.1 FkbM family methyltransferase [Bacteroides sp.]